MVHSLFKLAVSVAVLAVTATSSASAAAPLPSGQWPAATKSVKNKGAIVVAKGAVYDGKMQRFDRSDITCNGQKESGKADAMFILGAGATLKNVIIGKHQMEGVHCDSHDCTIENVWWEDVCEDALSVKGGSAKSVTRVIGGGARNAEDKVIQHNGPGTVTIEGFYAQSFGKLYRSCGTCGNVQRNVVLTNVLAVNPTASVVTVNQNYKDTAKFNNVHVKSPKKAVKICQWSQAAGDKDPKMVGDGPSGMLCQYSSSSVKVTVTSESRSMDTEEFDFSLLNSYNRTS